MNEIPVKIYKHTDGREVRIYSDKKERVGYKFEFSERAKYEKSMLFVPTGGDEWPFLNRATVPSLTDEEWFAAPVGEGWIEITN